jgi:aerobic-type carbon monoxide dehydrogenase small subunit (CoxS/CutS family)
MLYILPLTPDNDKTLEVTSTGRAASSYNAHIRWPGDPMSAVFITVNGKEHPVTASLDQHLLWVLREDLHLTGTKYGCGEGQCGACTVLIDGKALRSCITPLSSVVGRQVLTIEGLERDGALHPVQQAFLEEEAFQCGYCTPGMILSAASLLDSKANPSDEEIIQAMNGNICRCGTYPRIVAAIRRAAHHATKRTPA